MKLRFILFGVLAITGHIIANSRLQDLVEAAENMHVEKFEQILKQTEPLCAFDKKLIKNTLLAKEYPITISLLINVHNAFLIDIPGHRFFGASALIASIPCGMSVFSKRSNAVVRTVLGLSSLLMGSYGLHVFYTGCIEDEEKRENYRQKRG